VIRNFDRARQVAILQTKLRDLELSQLRMAAPFAVLTGEYRRAIADYLGSGRHPRPCCDGSNIHLLHRQKTIMNGTLRKLDALDAQRRAIESAIKPGGRSP